jgi:hypothetical protein
VTFPERASVSDTVEAVLAKELGDYLRGRIISSVVARSYRVRKSPIDVPPNCSLTLLRFGLSEIHHYSVVVGHAVDDAHITLEGELGDGHV